ncbi:MAG: recombination-associated protein RdgC [Desulfobacteraceae bacterium]|nr:recombination-associated protein RdgC [Desulfobacteraceae bacterium]
MGVLSSSVSITQYRVEGTIEDSFLETVVDSLTNNAIREIDNEPEDKSVGWTSLESPFKPDFSGSSYIFGTHLIFSLRIDKKSIPTKIVNKHLKMAIDKRLEQSERESLHRNEKSEIKDEVIRRLYMRMPATPNMYDLIWNYEEKLLWFLCSQKAANEELETLFTKTFKLSLIRMFPYTAAQLTGGLTDLEKDNMEKLSPSTFYRGQHA